MVGMRYRRAVEKLRILAEACESVKGWPPEDPFLLEAYAFGDVLQGADPLECVEVVLVLNLPPQDVVWGSSPHGTVWLADRLRLSKGGFCYWWRSHLDPVWNHHVREPVRFWSPTDPTRTCCERSPSAASVPFPGRPRPRPPAASSWPASWMRRSATCARCTLPTGTMTGGMSIAGWALAVSLALPRVPL